MISVKELIARRAAQELSGPCYVNLGIGIPTLIPEYVEEPTVFMQAENGLLGVDDLEDEDIIDPNLIDASKKPASEQPGSSYFDSAQSFGMISGGHIDITVLGVLQADETGQIANWTVPGKAILGVGGAMDLLSATKKVICTMTHVTKDGKAKLVRKCDFPITSTRQVDMIITDLAVFEYRDRKMYLVELMPGVTLEEVANKTEAHYEIKLR